MHYANNKLTSPLEDNARQCNAPTAICVIVLSTKPSTTVGVDCAEVLSFPKRKKSPLPLKENLRKG